MLCGKQKILVGAEWPNEYLTWKSQGRLCQIKKKKKKIHGGFGFHICIAFNLSLLAKVAWKVATNRCSLCVKLLRTKFKVRETTGLRGISPKILTNLERYRDS